MAKRIQTARHPRDLPHAIMLAPDEEINTGPARSVAIAGTALLDIWLRQLIEQRMRPDANLKAIFEDRGPLDSFSNRIAIAFAMNFIGTGAYLDLCILREIRNAFAHAAETFDFDREEISVKCDALWLPKKIKYKGLQDPTTSREKFIRAVKLIHDAIVEETVRKENNMGSSGFIHMGPPLPRPSPAPPKAPKQRLQRGQNGKVRGPT